MRRVVVVGAGLAGARTVQALRQRGYRGAVTLVGAETHLPYDRPPLSKEVLSGKADASTLDIGWDELDVQLLLGRRATGLRDGVVDTDAGPLDFDVLVVATGSRPVLLPGAQAHVLRTVDDALALRAALQRGGHLVVVGAGWIGAEVATAARSHGCRVTVVEQAGSPLAQALGEQVGAATVPWYAEAGVELLLGLGVAGVDGGDVHLSDGRVLAADVVVVGIGVRPDVAWLDGSPVRTDAGVLVDPCLRSSDPRVYAVGDAAAWESVRFGARLRVEHWDNALHAPDVVAANLLGEDVAYDPVPYFWSDQFGRTVQYVGHHGRADRFLWRGAPGGAAWGGCWLRDGRLVAAVAVGRPRDTLQARKAIAAGAEPDLARLADPGVPVKEAVSARR